MIAVDDRSAVGGLDVRRDLAAETQGFQSFTDGCSCISADSVLSLLRRLLLFLVDGFEALADAFEVFELLGAVFVFISIFANSFSE